MTDTFTRADEESLLAEADYYEQKIIDGEPMTTPSDKQTDNQPALQPPEWIGVRVCIKCRALVAGLNACPHCGCDWIGTSYEYARVRDGVAATVDQFNAWIANYWPDWRKGSQAKVELMRAAWDAATRLANFNELALKGCHEYTVELEKVQALAYQMARHIRNTDEIPATQWGVQGMRLLEQLNNINPEQYEHEVKAATTAPIAAPVEEGEDRIPCQRCGLFGGKVVSFGYDSIKTARWICPHCLDKQENER